ncbi:MAG: SGNH/GDSL hydrolase family protein [Eubacteriales bacterium]
MIIASIDKNFASESEFGKKDVVWLDVSDEPFEIYGLYDPKNNLPYIRMPREVAKSVNENVGNLNAHTAGGRVRFSTDSPYIAIRVEASHSELPAHMTFILRCGFDLYSNQDGFSSYVKTFIPPMQFEGSYTACNDSYTNGKMTEFTLNFPLYGGVKKLYIGVKEGSRVGKGAKYRNAKPVVFYGSSITQGGCASRPGMSYEALISQRYNLDYINMGFAGNCKAEIEMANYLRGLDASVFVCDYDHNAPNLEYYEQTHARFYRLYREKQPDTPYVIVTRPSHFYYNRSACVARLDIAYRTYSEAVKAGDKNVYFVDGMHLFDGDGYDNCTVDGVHPNDLGHYRMSELIGDAVIEILKHG